MIGSIFFLVLFVLSLVMGWVFNYRRFKYEVLSRNGEVPDFTSLPLSKMRETRRSFKEPINEDSMSEENKNNYAKAQRFKRLQYLSHLTLFLSFIGFIISSSI